jgi:hypothetical protein
MRTAFIRALALCYDAQTHIRAGVLMRLRSFSCNTTFGDYKEGGSHVEAERVAVEQERQSFRLWRNGEDGGRCLGRGGISACRAAAFRADLKGDC